MDLGVPSRDGLDDARAHWDQLVTAHDRAVRVALLARGIRTDRARDLAQAAWTTLWAKHREGRLERLELPGLAIRQALFLAMEEARSRQAQSTDPVSEELADPSPSVDGRIFSRQQLARIRTELERCPPNAQKIFFLVHGNAALSHTDVAERVGLSVQRVRQTLCELRQRLRPILEEQS